MYDVLIISSFYNLFSCKIHEKLFLTKFEMNNDFTTKTTQEGKHPWLNHLQNTIIQSRHVETNKIVSQISLRKGQRKEFWRINHFTIDKGTVTSHEAKSFGVCAIDRQFFHPVGSAICFYYKLNNEGKLIRLYTDYNNHGLLTFVYPRLVWNYLLNRITS